MDTLENPPVTQRQEVVIRLPWYLSLPIATVSVALFVALFGGAFVVLLAVALVCGVIGIAVWGVCCLVDWVSRYRRRRRQPEVSFHVLPPRNRRMGTYEALYARNARKRDGS